MPVKICWLYSSFQHFAARHDVTRARRRERGAGVSRSECEQWGLVRRWGRVSKASPGCAQYAAAGCCTIDCRLPKLRPIHDQRAISRSQPLRQASGRQRPMATVEGGLRGQDIQVLLERKIEPVSDAVLWLLRPLVPRSFCLSGPVLQDGRGAGEAGRAPVSFARCLT